MIYSDTTPDEHLQALKSSSHPPSAYKLLGKELSAGFKVLITWWLSPVQSQPIHHTSGHTASTPNMRDPRPHSWAAAPKRSFRNFPTLGEQGWDASLGPQAWGSPQKLPTGGTTTTSSHPPHPAPSTATPPAAASSASLPHFPSNQRNNPSSSQPEVTQLLPRPLPTFIPYFLLTSTSSLCPPNLRSC